MTYPVYAVRYIHLDSPYPRPRPHIQYPCAIRLEGRKMQPPATGEMDENMVEEIKTVLLFLVIRELVATGMVGMIAATVGVMVVEDAGSEGCGVG